METRSVRSYRLRGSRITPSQATALDRFWPIYGIEIPEGKLDLPALFPDSKEIIMETDVHPLFEEHLEAESLDGIHLFFPDPWPKKKHQKRRIVNPDFLNLIAPKIKPGGFIHIATDWVPYAEVIQEVFSASEIFEGGVVDRPEWRPLTRFEGQGITKDHQVTDLRYIRK